MKRKTNMIFKALIFASVLALAGCATEDVQADPTTEEGATLSTVVSDVTAQIESLEITVKTGAAFVSGTNIAKDDLNVVAIMSDGSRKPITDFTFEGATALETGDNTFTVSYTLDGKTVTDNVTVNATAAVTAIVATVDDAVRYIGDELDRSSVHVSAQYEDGTETPDIEDWTCSDLILYDAENNFKIEFGGKSVNITVSATEKPEGMATTPAATTTTDTDAEGDTLVEDAELVTDIEDDPTAPTGDIPATVTWTYTALVMDNPNDPLDWSCHYETFTVTTRNPGLHSVEYYQAHPWKLYNENNTDELGNISFLGWDSGVQCTPWDDLYNHGLNMCLITDDSYLRNFTIKTASDYYDVKRYQTMNNNSPYIITD